MGESDEKPIHSVTLDSFGMSKHLVTVGHYGTYCTENKRKMPESPFFNANWNKKDHPIVNVTWEDAMGYCDWLSKKTGKHYDLPTEAEWEYAARGGLEDKAYPWGDTWDGSKCSNYANSEGSTVAVGSYPANGYGLYDMSGNVLEWCKDWYRETYSTSLPIVNPLSRSSVGGKILRGGSWSDDDPGFFRCAFRLYCKPTSSNYITGFRLILR